MRSPFRLMPLTRQLVVSVRGLMNFRILNRCFGAFILVAILSDSIAHVNRLATDSALPTTPLGYRERHAAGRKLAGADSWQLKK